VVLPKEAIVEVRGNFSSLKNATLDDHIDEHTLDQDGTKQTVAPEQDPVTLARGGFLNQTPFVQVDHIDSNTLDVATGTTSPVPMISEMELFFL
jgi:hypothetical protein